MIKLGVNIDHVATLRQLRLGTEPDLVKAALEAEAGGADGITIHLREDRRHIQDADLPLLKKRCRVPLNLEMALNDEILAIALKIKPEKVCIVPERRLELTTEGGLDAISKSAKLAIIIPMLQKKGIEVSLFIDPILEQIRIAKAVRADAIEIHTGTYANARKKSSLQKELSRIRESALLGASLGLKVHAGHGIDYRNIFPLLKIRPIVEFNIGYSIVTRSVFVGLRNAVKEMKGLLRRA